MGALPATTVSRTKQIETVILHALRERFPTVLFAAILVLSRTVTDLFFICVGRHTYLSTNFEFRSFYLQNAHTNLIPGYLKHIFEAKRLGTIELLQKREPTFSDDVLAVVNIVLV